LGISPFFYNTTFSWYAKVIAKIIDFKV